MKRSRNILSAGIWISFGILFLSLLTTCKKYVDGPLFSMRFKNTRIANEWVFEQVTVDGVDYTDSLDYLETGVYVEFTKGGDYKVVVPDPDSVVTSDTIYKYSFTIVKDTLGNPIDTTYDTTMKVFDRTVIPFIFQDYFEDNGVWIFEKKSKKEYLLVQRSNPEYDIKMYITELKEKHFSYYYTETDEYSHLPGTYEVRLKPLTKYLREKVRGE